MIEKCSNKCMWTCVGEGWWGVKGECGCVLGMNWQDYACPFDFCSTNMLSSCCSPMTKEYNWQIIHISVMPFCHWLAACTWMQSNGHAELLLSIHTKYTPTLTPSHPTTPPTHTHVHTHPHPHTHTPHTHTYYCIFQTYFACNWMFRHI